MTSEKMKIGYLIFTTGSLLKFLAVILVIGIVDFFVAQHLFIHTALSPFVLVALNLLIYYLCLPWIKKGVTEIEK
ncbi:hypothetical protein GCM10007103_28080 [Salinimicrobium marinum]|uniref:Uncharacterized protein n=1 Tax=Salinimicrobium marinum TaxID=680283 RepID=A0A918W138_9FLAO|nr:hypothetical protein [Salinimicrobium marinum]GHA45414.1 hypothetical protein GCM10007103_28080 [Salinimicrobium marinum]